MPRLIKIDLNKWDVVGSKDDLEGYSGLTITPKKLVNGIQPDDIFFRRGKQQVPEIENVEEAVWYKDCLISKNGSLEDYIKRIDWWFESALNDEDYKEIINNTFNRNGFDIKMSWEKAKNWLISRNQSSRKTYIHKFVWNWLSKGMTMQLNRLERLRK